MLKPREGHALDIHNASKFDLGRYPKKIRDDSTLPKGSRGLEYLLTFTIKKINLDVGECTIHGGFNPVEPTHLKYISQIGSFHQNSCLKIKKNNIWNHHKKIQKVTSWRVDPLTSNYQPTTVRPSNQVASCFRRCEISRQSWKVCSTIKIHGSIKSWKRLLKDGGRRAVGVHHTTGRIVTTNRKTRVKFMVVYLIIYKKPG